MLKPDLLKILACPLCKRTLEYDQSHNKLICHECCLKYPIEKDIPIMLVERAEKI